MEVTGLTIDPVNNSPIVLLREKGGSRVVPIWIGAVEASAIAFEIEGIKLPRPMTHDLLKASIEALGGDVVRVVVVDLRENTYYAIVVVAQDGQMVEIDARPSDAIALALRVQAPVLCDSDVIDRAQVTADESDANLPEEASAQPGTEAEAEEEPDSVGPRPIVDTGSQTPEDLLESLDPEDFGKYKM